MLTTTARWSSRAAPAAVALAFFGIYLFWFTPPDAFADRDDPACWVDPGDGVLEYICDEYEQEDEENNVPGNTEPPCDLEQFSNLNGDGVRIWCEGEIACWANFPSAVYGAEGPPDEEPPSENHMYIFKKCYGPNGDPLNDGIWTWYEPPEPPLDVLALQAFGRLATPAFTLDFNPPERSYVFIETWWGAGGAGTGEIIGTSALGVRAIGEPDYIEVNPGDGTGTIQCPWTTEPSEACSHAYGRASVNGSATSADGSPAYLAEARLVYSVRFEQNGTPFELEGLPDSLESPWVTTPVPVAEIQTTVTGG